MRYLILPLLLACSVPVPAAAEPLDLSGVVDLIAQKAKEAKGAGLFAGDSSVSAALYLPVWTFHTAGAEPVDLVEVGVGAEFGDAGRSRPFLAAAFNLPGFSARLWNFQWARDHLRRSIFPPVFFGPYVRPPLPGQGAWVFGSEVGGLVSVRLGK